MTTHSNYSLQNFSTNNAKVLTGNSQPVPDFKYSSQNFFFGKIRPIFNTENDFDSTHFEMFEEVFHNFGKSDGDMIQ